MEFAEGPAPLAYWHLYWLTFESEKNFALSDLDAR